MRDHMDFDLTPCDENCAQVGRDNYAVMANHEFVAMRDMLEREFGAFPDSVLCRRYSNPHDFGTYYSLRLSYDDDDQTAVEYVFNIESNWPTTWDDKAREYLKSNNALASTIDPRV